jgi:hypothetical protein
MAIYVYVDNSNLWIEGQRVAASIRNHVSLGETLDPNWRYDFGKLYELACPQTEKLGRTSLFGSTPPLTDSLWKRADAEGWDVRTHPRNASNKEKQVDSSIITLMLTDCFKYMQPDDRVVLISGDADFVPAIKPIQQAGHQVTVMFWSHASRELVDKANTFVSLNDHFDFLTAGFDRAQRAS